MKFSIRQMLIVMVGFALFAAATGAGANGSSLGFGMAISFTMLFFFFAVFAAIYWGTWLCFKSARLPVSVRTKSTQNLNKTESNPPADATELES